MSENAEGSKFCRIFVPCKARLLDVPGGTSSKRNEAGGGKAVKGATKWVFRHALEQIKQPVTGKYPGLAVL
ncbi:hypothetical protein DX130_12590 [Paenibacillus paeoniae]|uniref:Uncharacterized protein n=1 Tax=Paenibacillus paeoniae TaxID=2292705 RepID=A0A371PF72_9BACL|nr:hypothetical protein DX130_12590 [Paenibacillus paeoniae]